MVIIQTTFYSVGKKPNNIYVINSLNDTYPGAENRKISSGCYLVNNSGYLTNEIDISRTNGFFATLSYAKLNSFFYRSNH